MARTLGVGGYGVIALAAAITLYLAQLVDFGIETLGIREVAQDPTCIPRRAPAILTARLLIAFGLIVIALPVALFAAPQPEGAVIAVYTLTLLPIAVSTRWIHVGLESARPVGLTRTLGEAVMLTLVVLLVGSAGHVGRVPLAQFAGESVAALVLLFLLAKHGHRFVPTVDIAPAKPVFRRALPLVGHSLLGLLIFNSDLVFLRLFRDLASVGQYAAAYTLISFLLNLGVAYGMALLPTLTRLGAGTDDERNLYRTAQVQVFAAGFPLAVGGALLAGPLIREVFGPSYLPAARALEILIWSIPIALFRNVAVSALVARNRQDQVLRTTTGSTVLNLVMNVAFIPPFGIVGAAWATVATELLRALLALKYAGDEGLASLPFPRLGRPLAAGLAMLLALLAIRPSSVWLAIGLGVVAYGLALAATGGIRFGRDRRPRLRL